MATLVDRLLGTVDPSEEGDPFTRRIPIHEFFAFLRVYKYSSPQLFPSNPQWANYGRDIFDLSTGQRSTLVNEFMPSALAKDMHLFESSLILGTFESFLDGTLAMTQVQVREQLGLT